MDQCRSCLGKLKTGRTSIGLKRRSVNSKLKNSASKLSVKEATKSILNESLTPDRYFCENCFKNQEKVLAQAAKSEKACSSIKVIKRKTFCPSVSPIAKRICFSPKHHSTPKQKQPQTKIKQ